MSQSVNPETPTINIRTINEAIFILAKIHRHIAEKNCMHCRHVLQNLERE